MRSEKRTPAFIFGMSIVLALVRFLLVQGIDTVVTISFDEVGTSLLNQMGKGHDEKVQRILGVSNSVGFLPNRIRIAEGWRDIYQNTFFYDNITLNLTQFLTDDSVTLGVLGHELGHWWHGDIRFEHALKFFSFTLEVATSFIIHQNASVFSIFWIFDRPEVACSISLLLGRVIKQTLNPLVLYRMRSNELRADAFCASLDLGENFVSYLKYYSTFANIMTATNLYIIMHLTHPPMEKRIPALLLLLSK
jgi:hypothetical protein